MRAVFVQTIFELAKIDPRICYLASDLQPEILERMKAEMPGRSFMFGVSEQAMVDTAVGLALEGMVPWCHTIATFLTRRCFEQVALAAQQNLPIRLLANGGGLCYSHLGSSHLAIDDIALMRSIPNMTVIAPCSVREARELALESKDYPGPLYFRVGVTQDVLFHYLPDGIGRVKMSFPKRQPARVCIVSTGCITAQAQEAAKILNNEGIFTNVVHCHTVSPIDAGAIARCATGTSLVVTVEEHSISGGLGSAVTEATSGLPNFQRIVRAGIPHVWPDKYGDRQDLLRYYNLLPEQLVELVSVNL